MYLLNIETLPKTGEVIKNYSSYIGIGIIIIIILFLLWRKNKDKDNN